jgi:hypothetical protein
MAKAREVHKVGPDGLTPVNHDVHPHTRAVTLPDTEVRPPRGQINNITRRIKLRTISGKIKRITDGT